MEDYHKQIIKDLQNQIKAYHERPYTFKNINDDIIWSIKAFTSNDPITNERKLKEVDDVIESRIKRAVYKGDDPERRVWDLRLYRRDLMLILVLE